MRESELVSPSYNSVRYLEEQENVHCVLVVAILLGKTNRQTVID